MLKIGVYFSYSSITKRDIGGQLILPKAPLLAITEANIFICCPIKPIEIQMAQFLDTQAISNELMKLIKDAKERIILVSYSFKVNPQIQERLKTKSKVGNLSEIVIVYGRTELKQTEIEWLSEVQDLKLYEKSNLHAKCYLNEDRAIICSMNLYDYSQQNNIEMGILITRHDDRKAYDDLLEEIMNIKINGVRKQLSQVVQPPSVKFEATNSALTISKPQAELSVNQEKIFAFLKKWRLERSKQLKLPAYEIFNDADARKLVAMTKINKDAILECLPKRQANQHGPDILEIIETSRQYTIGEVLSLNYQSSTSGYDRVKLRVLDSGVEQWFDTIQELPEKKSIVAVRLNSTWFNDYFYLESRGNS